jgi:ribosome-binding protein aMBF1 (putative translation factor)
MFRPEEVVLIATHLTMLLYCVDMGTQMYQVRSGVDLGRVVRDARSERGLTQQQVIEQLGLSFDRSRLARIEAGEGFQSLDRALSLLRRLGVEVIATVPTADESA